MRPISELAPVPTTTPVAAPRGDHGAGIGHRPAVPQNGARIDRRDLLARGQRLAGQDRLLDRQARCRDQAEIGRHLGARLELDDVAADDALGRDLDAAAVAQHCRARCQHAAQRLQRLLRLALLEEADQRIGDHHGQNDDGVDVVAEQRGNGGGGHQHQDQQVLELGDQALQRGAARRLRQPVGPLGLKAPRGLRCRTARCCLTRRGQARVRPARPKGVGRPSYATQPYATARVRRIPVSMQPAWLLLQ